MSEQLKELQNYLDDYDFYSTSPIGPYAPIEQFRLAVKELTAAQQRVAELERALSAWREWVEHEYSERKNVKSDYQRGYRDGLDAADTQMDKALGQ